MRAAARSVLGVSDPSRLILRRAGRAAVIVPGTFAVVDVLSGEQAALFAGFGTIALTVFADFGGAPLPRTRAYALTALAGVPLILLGTALSGSLPAAVAVTLVAVFAVRIAGALGGYSEAAGVTLILAFVLAIAIEAPLDEVGSRLIGWFAAALAAAGAALVLWPHRERSRLRGLAAAACRELAAAIQGGSPAGELASLTALERHYAATPYRPAGPWDRYRALRRLIDELTRVSGYLPLAPDRGSADSELRSATAATLERCAERLAGGATVPDLLGLERVRGSHSAGAVDAVSAALADGAPGEEILERIDARVRLRLVSFTALSVGANSMIATGAETPPVTAFEIAPETSRSQGPLGALRGTLAVLRSALDPHSARLHDALRVGIGLAAAVLVAQVADISHAFWVVLATLLVLRTDAVGTGRTALEAILGTSIGFVFASLLMIAIGDSTILLWIAMPIAAFLAAYTPGAVHFIVGQGAFTLFVIVLFNLVEPEGWQVALVRLEDVAIGAGVSLVIGFLLWPRGAGVVLRQSLAEAIRLGGRYLSDAFATVLVTSAAGGPVAVNREAVIAASERSSEALRQHLSEPGMHLRNRTWDSIVAVPHQLRGTADILLAIAERYGSGAGEALKPRAEAVARRYSELAGRLGPTAGVRPTRTRRKRAATLSTSWSTPDPARIEQEEATAPRAQTNAADERRAREAVLDALRGAQNSDEAHATATRLALAYEWTILLTRFADDSSGAIAEAAARSAQPWWR